jgi:hypothetical protein
MDVKNGRRKRTQFIWIWILPSCGSCNSANKPSGYMKVATRPPPAHRSRGADSGHHSATVLPVAATNSNSCKQGLGAHEKRWDQFICWKGGMCQEATETCFICPDIFLTKTKVKQFSIKRADTLLEFAPRIFIIQCGINNNTQIAL